MCNSFSSNTFRVFIFIQLVSIWTKQICDNFSLISKTPVWRIMCRATLQIQERENVFREIFHRENESSKSIKQTFSLVINTWRRRNKHFFITQFFYYFVRARKILILILKYCFSLLNINLRVPARNVATRSRQCIEIFVILPMLIKGSRKSITRSRFQGFNLELFVSNWDATNIRRINDVSKSLWLTLNTFGDLKTTRSWI